MIKSSIYENKHSAKKWNIVKSSSVPNKFHELSSSYLKISSSLATSQQNCSFGNGKETIFLKFARTKWLNVSVRTYKKYLIFFSVFVKNDCLGPKYFIAIYYYQARTSANHCWVHQYLSCWVLHILNFQQVLRFISKVVLLAMQEVTNDCMKWSFLLIDARLSNGAASFSFRMRTQGRGGVSCFRRVYFLLAFHSTSKVNILLPMIEKN